MSSFRALACAALSACTSISLDERLCPFDVHATHVKGETYRCGFVDMGNSDRTRVRVAVIAFRSGSKEPPVFQLSGGPSQSWSNLGIEAVTRQDFEGAGRDYVFIEQRGTGVSEPTLICRESDQTYGACAERLQAERMFPEDFNTLKLADDVERVRQALGYDDILLLGTSYGTTWARAVLARHGSHVRAAVLDSVVSGTFGLLSRFASGTDEAFSALFAACAADITCNTFVPDLEIVMLDTMESLRQQPLQDAAGHVVLDHKDFFVVTRSLLSAHPEQTPLFIKIVADAAASGVVPTVMESEDETSEPNEADGQYYSIFCSDNADVTAADIDIDLQRVRPAFRDTLGPIAHFIRQVCDEWPSRSATFDSRSYDGPVLLLAGALDPRTPPSWARDALSTLQHGQLVVVPGVGHNVATSSMCTTRIVGAFLGGNRSPRVDCVASLTPQFETEAPGRQERRFAVRHGYHPLDIMRPLFERR